MHILPLTEMTCICHMCNPCALQTTDAAHPARAGAVFRWHRYAECPVVAVNSGGPLESIVEGVTGFLCPQEPKLWAEAISVLIANPAQRVKMGKAGRQRVVDTFSLHSFARTLDSHVRSDGGSDAAESAEAEETTGAAAAARGGGKDTSKSGGNEAQPRRSVRLRTPAKGTKQA